MGDTYLITGGAGFLGSHLARAALAGGREVVVADNLLTGLRENVPAGCRFIYMDLANPEHYYKLEDVHPGAILHCAGQSSGEISFDSPVNDVEINTLATIRLARWGLARKCSRFLYASSVSVYGNGCGQAMKETDPPAPLSYYGCSKLASEAYLRLMQDAEGLQPTLFRLFNLYGPGQNMANFRQGMVSIYLGLILLNRPLLVKGSLERFRDFVFVDDCVKVWLDAVENRATWGQTLNVGSGRRTTVRELINLLRTAAKKPDYSVETGPGTPGDAFGSVADTSRLEEVTGYCPDTPLEEGLSRMVAFHLGDAGGT